MTPLEDQEKDDKREREANYFAMCLLMPESLVRREVSAFKTIDLIDESKELRALADLFQVSEPLMLLRLIQLEIVRAV